MIDRRKFIQSSIATVGTTLLASQLLKGETLNRPTSKIQIKQNEVILFQGDSITDHGRNKTANDPNQIPGFGQGYAMVAASSLLHKFAGKNIQIYNRGISGNKIPQLESRWQEDCFDLKPTILSILIGVNDYWHKRDGRYESSATSYKEDYKRLLDHTLAKLPDVKLIIGEPFVMKGVKYVDETWFPEFAQYQKAAREIASEYGAILIPYQSIFDKAEKSAPGDYWTTDGIHTSLAGVNLMAEAWLSCIK